MVATTICNRRLISYLHETGGDQWLAFFLEDGKRLASTAWQRPAVTETRKGPLTRRAGNCGLPTNEIWQDSYPKGNAIAALNSVLGQPRTATKSPQLFLWGFCLTC